MATAAVESYARVPVAYRSAIVAVDFLSAPGTVTCTKLTAVGSLTAGTYNIKVVARNAYGRTTPTAGNVAVTTETTNLGVRAAFAAVSGATGYDIYCSVDADPKFVGRITEAQRASGGILSGAVPAAFSAGGAVNSIDIYTIGTGQQSGTTAAQNTAYSIPATPIDCTGAQYCDFDLTLTTTADVASPTLIVIPFYLNSRTGVYAAGPTTTIVFGGVSAAYLPLSQRLRIETRGSSGLALLVVSISGTGASLNIDGTLS